MFHQLEIDTGSHRVALKDHPGDYLCLPIDDASKVKAAKKLFIKDMPHLGVAQNLGVSIPPITDGVQNQIEFSVYLRNK